MRSLFFLAWALELCFTLATWLWLPEQVGDPGKTTSRTVFVALMLGLSIWVPWQCVMGLNAMVRRWPGAINLPNKAYWLQPEHLPSALARLKQASYELGLLMLAQFSGLQGFILLRSRPDWPQLPSLVWFAGAAMLATLLVIWVLRLQRRFVLPSGQEENTGRRPPPRGPVHRPRS